MQLLGDHHGHSSIWASAVLVAAASEIMEECPSPLMAAHPEMRQAMGNCGVARARPGITTPGHQFLTRGVASTF
jgi:hypothetical protein